MKSHPQSEIQNHPSSIASATEEKSRTSPVPQSKIKNRKSKIPHPILYLLPSILLLANTGCTLLTYRTPTGERLTRSSLGANTSVSSLTLESNTNGVRRVELRGYKNDSAQAMGAVTEAAVKAAIQSVK